MRYLYFFGFALVFFEIYVGNTTQSNEWQKTADKNGIVTYIGEKNQNGIKPTKAMMVVRGTPENVLSVINNIEAYPKWVPKCASSKVLDKNDDEMSFYQVFSVPVINDRDLVATSHLSKIDKGYNINIKASPDKIETPKGKVRITDFSSDYKITDLGDGTTKIELLTSIDLPGIPAFLLNWANKKQPYKTFAGMREQILNL